MKSCTYVHAHTHTHTHTHTQVRYENAHCSLREAHGVMEDFVRMCLTGQTDAFFTTEEEAKNTLIHTHTQKGGASSSSTTTTKPKNIHTHAQPKKEADGERRGGGGGGGGGMEEGEEKEMPLKIQSVDPSVLAVPGFVKNDIYTPKFSALQYIELFSLT